MNFIKSHWPILAAFTSVIFGYANFTGEIKANAEDIKKVYIELKDYKEKTDEKLDRLIRVTERIDERTLSWQKK